MLFALFFALPIGYAIYLSLRESHIKGLGLGAHARTEVWAGLANYRSALSDPELLASAGRILTYGALLVPTMLGLALFFALLMDTRGYASAASPSSRSSCPTRCPASSPRCSGASSTCRP